MRYKRIISTVIVGYVIMAAYFIFWAYQHSLQLTEQGTLMRLRGITNSLAIQINADSHTKLLERHPSKDGVTQLGQDSLYDRIHKILADHHTANMLKSPVYTLVYDSSIGKYVFGVTSAEIPYFRHPYNSFPQTLMDMYHEGAVIPMYEDEFGVWLSAFSVVRDSQGRTIALVQADEPFDVFIKSNRLNMWRNIAFGLIVFLALLGVLLWILQPMLIREKRDRQALADANEKISQLDRFRQEMLANVSHDLRTPLSSILGFSETILQKKRVLSDTDMEQYLNIISSEARRMNKMVSELFDLSKLESGQIQLNKEPMNMAELAQDILQVSYIHANERSVRILTELQDHIPLVQADVYWLDRVLQNLWSNALQYVEMGGLVKFTIFTDVNNLHVKVCNSGRPIPEQELPHVFERYFRASDNTLPTGSGLGLAIAHHIILLHNGRIWAEVNGNITTFRFSIPLD
jgi:signal transduction histidine kinase